MAWVGNAHRTIYERKQVILRLYLSNFTSEHTAELGLGQGIRLLGWLGTKSRRSAAPHGSRIYCALVLVQSIRGVCSICFRLR